MDLFANYTYDKLRMSSWTHRLYFNLRTLGLFIIFIYMPFLSAQVNSKCQVSLQIKTHFQNSLFEGKSGKNQIYVSGDSGSVPFVYLSKAEYLAMVKDRTAVQNTIIIVESLPLHLDLPFVSGVITLKPIRTRQTHVELFAKSLKIPLVFIELTQAQRQKVTKHAKLKQRFLRLQVREGHIDMTLSQVFSPKPRFKSVIQVLGNLSHQRFVTDFSEHRFSQIDSFGQKFIELMNIMRELPYLGRNHLKGALSSGFYKYFLSSAKFDKLPLEQYINSRLARVEQSTDLKFINLQLSEIRFAIEHAQIEEIFFKTISKLVSHEFGLNSKLMVRSNNGFDNLIGSLYLSRWAKSGNVEDLEPVIRSIWASRFEFRPQQVRHYLGLTEAQDSMPLMIQPYIENDFYGGTCEFTIDVITKKLKMSVVLSANSTATNPGESHEPLQLVVTPNSREIVEVKPGKSDSPKLEQDFKDIKFALLNLYGIFAPIVQKDLIYKKYLPEKVAIEFLIHRPTTDSEGATNYNFSPLQYRNVYSGETVMAVLAGNIARSDLYAYSKLSNSDDLRFEARTHELIGSLGLKNLKTMLQMKRFVRFALIRQKSEHTIIATVFSNHQPMKNRLEHHVPDAQWLAEGLLNFDVESKVVSVSFELQEQQFADIVLFYQAFSQAFIRDYDKSMDPTTLRFLRRKHDRSEPRSSTNAYDSSITNK